MYTYKLKNQKKQKKYFTKEQIIPLIDNNTVLTKRSGGCSFTVENSSIENIIKYLESANRINIDRSYISGETISFFCIGQKYSISIEKDKIKLLKKSEVV